MAATLIKNLLDDTLPLPIINSDNNKAAIMEKKSPM